MAYQIVLGIPCLNFSLKSERSWKEQLEVDTTIMGRRYRGLTLRHAFRVRMQVPAELLADLPNIIKVTQSKHKTFPDVGQSGEYSCTVYSRAAKSVIESLDPGVHQFFPIAKTVNRRNEEIDAPYFIGVISPLPNAIDANRSPVHFTRVSPQSDLEVLTITQGQKAEGKTMTLKSEIIVGRHIWGGAQGMLDNYNFCSDKFFERWTSEKLQGLDFLRCHVI